MQGRPNLKMSRKLNKEASRKLNKNNVENLIKITLSFILQGTSILS